MAAKKTPDKEKKGKALISKKTGGPSIVSEGFSPADAFLQAAEEFLPKALDRGKECTVRADTLDDNFQFLYHPDLLHQWALKRPGYVLGRIKLIIGYEGVGKSSELYNDCNLAIQQGGFAAVVALENADSTEHIKCYCDPKRLLIVPCDTLEQGIEASKKLIELFKKLDPENKLPKVLGFDSVGGATMEKLLAEDAEMGAPKPGGIGAIMSDFVNVMKTACRQTNTLWVVLNQAREKIAIGFAAQFPVAEIEKLVAKGGRALPFHASYFEVLKRGATLKDETGGSLKAGFGITKVWKKNKTGVPFVEVNYTAEWGRGFNYAPDTMQALAMSKICGLQVEKKRYWCDAIGIPKEQQMKAEDIYPIIHSPQFIGMFQKELGIIMEKDALPPMAPPAPPTNPDALKLQTPPPPPSAPLPSAVPVPDLPAPTAPVAGGYEVSAQASVPPAGTPMEGSNV